jgi:regulatory protein
MSKKVTALKVQKNKPQRIAVYLDGEFAFGLSRLQAVWLQIGQELTDEKIVAMQRDDEREVAYQQCLKYLGYRERSEYEICQFLKIHNYTEDIILSVIERLHQNGLVDDTRFARVWTENRSEFRPRSRRALQIELRQKGVSSEIISETLNNLDDEEMAYRAARKHAKWNQQLDRAEFQRKLSGFLTRRGFSYSVITPVVRRLLAEFPSQEQSGDQLSYFNEKEKI